MDDFRYLRSRDPNKNAVTASLSKKFGKHDSSPRSGTVWMWAILGRLRRCAVNVCRACAVYLCSVWDFARDLSGTQDVVSSVRYTWRSSRHRPEWTTVSAVGFTVRVAADFFVLSVIILELKRPHCATVVGRAQSHPICRWKGPKRPKVQYHTYL